MSTEYDRGSDSDDELLELVTTRDWREGQPLKKLYNPVTGRPFIIRANDDDAILKTMLRDANVRDIRSGIVHGISTTLTALVDAYFAHEIYRMYQTDRENFQNIGPFLGTFVVLSIGYFMASVPQIIKGIKGYIAERKEKIGE